jgi:hypothetical protein
MNNCNSLRYGINDKHRETEAGNAEQVDSEGNKNKVTPANLSFICRNSEAFYKWK